MEESPLHPFELHNYIPISLGGLDISINKAVIMMWVVVALISILMVTAGSARRLVPGKLQSLAEMLVDFIRGIILDTMGKDGMKFFPLITTLFLFILFCNLIGLIPGSYTVTSQIVVTAVFACTVYGLSLLMGFVLHGGKFFGILVPPGTPGWLLPLMVPIELISQLARPISLAGRTRDPGCIVRISRQWRGVDWMVALRVHDRYERSRSRHRIHPSLHIHRVDLRVFGRCVSFAWPRRACTLTRGDAPRARSDAVSVCNGRI
jgi:F-type H+-transporting ATPase subunit a